MKDCCWVCRKTTLMVAKEELGIWPLKLQIPRVSGWWQGHHQVLEGSLSIIRCDIPELNGGFNGKIIYKHPAGPETVPIKRSFFKKMVILPQCRATLMIGNPGKTWGAFFVFQRHRCNTCVVNSWRSAFLWMHLHCQALRDLRDLSSVATCM